MDGEVGWWTISGNIGLPPLARVMGVGSQQQHLIRDHYSIECTIQQSTPLQNREIVSYRNVKQIDIDQFFRDVSESPTLHNIQGTVNELVDRYILGLRALLDKHAPTIHRVVTVRTRASWYTESLRDAKRRRRRLERLWRHGEEDAHLLAYRQQC